MTPGVRAATSRLWIEQARERGKYTLQIVLQHGDPLLKLQLFHLGSGHSATENLHLPARSAERHEWLPVQAEPRDVKRTSEGQGCQLAISPLAQMLLQSVTPRVQQPLRGGERLQSRPEVTLQPVAGGTAVDRIVRVICTAGRARPEVIYFQFIASFSFMYGTIATTSPVGVPHGSATCLFCHGREVCDKPT